MKSWITKMKDDHQDMYRITICTEKVQGDMGANRAVTNKNNCYTHIVILNHAQSRE